MLAQSQGVRTMPNVTITIPESIRFTIPQSAANVIESEGYAMPEGVTTDASGAMHIPADKLPPETLVRLLEYGASRYVNDKSGGSTKTADDKATIASDWAQRLIAGDLGRKSGGGGGRRIDLDEKAMRQVMEDWLRDQGHKAAQAKQLAKDPANALRREIADKLNARVDAKKVGEAFDKNWPKFEAKAKQLADKWREAQGDDIGLDLGGSESDNAK
jgi:hypothetical protein